MIIKGETIDRLLTLKGVSQKDLAKAVGLEEKTFSARKKTGKFNRSEIVDMAHFLDITPEQLQGTVHEATITEGPLQGIEQHLNQIEENMVALATRLLKGQEQILNLLTLRNGHSKEVLPGEKPLRKGSQK